MATERHATPTNAAVATSVAVRRYRMGSRAGRGTRPDSLNPVAVRLRQRVPA